MRTESLIANQLLMAQAIFSMAEHLAASTGYQLTPVLIQDLPAEPKLGMIACVVNSDTQSYGLPVAPWGGSGPGPYSVMVFYNGTDWTVAAK